LIDPVIDCLEAHRPDAKIRLRHSSEKNAEINARLLKSPLLNILDMKCKCIHETSAVLQYIAKAPNKLQCLRLDTEAWYKSHNQLESKYFKQIVEAFPGLQALVINISIEYEEWVRFGSLYSMEKKKSSSN
jgi:hypothetical protein